MVSLSLTYERGGRRPAPGRPGSQGRLAAAGEWVLNEKRLTERAGLGSVQDQLRRPEQDLGTLVSGVRAALELRDEVWAGE